NSLKWANDLTQHAAVRLQVHPGIALLPGVVGADIRGRSRYRRDKGGFDLIISGPQFLLRHSQRFRRQLHAIELLRIFKKRGVPFIFYSTYARLDDCILFWRTVVYLPLQLKLSRRYYSHP